jgi:hypothetical protein
MACCYYCKMTGARQCEPHCGLCPEHDTDGHPAERTMEAKR